MKKIYLNLFCSIVLFFALGITTILSQCTNFTVTPTSTESRCKESGTITVNVTPAGTYTYSLTGPITVGATTSNVFGSLPKGTYTVSVTDGACTTTKSVVVAGNYVEPGLQQATVTKIACPNGTGCINAIQPTGGRTPYTYALIAPSPIVRPFQSAKEFCDLTPGVYKLQSLDSCGVVRTSDFTVANDFGDFTAYVLGYDLQYANCNDLILPTITGFTNTTSHNQLKVWYVTPAGDTLKVNSLETIPIKRDTLVNYAHTYGTWQVLAYDKCGRERKSTFVFNNPNRLSLDFGGQICGGYKQRIANNWKYGLDVGFKVLKCSDNSVVYSTDVTPPTQYYSPYYELEYGICYKYIHFNSCGDTVTTTQTINGRIFEIEGCYEVACSEVGQGTINLNQKYLTGSLPVTFKILEGPEGVGTTATQVAFQSWTKFNNMTLGTYKIEGVDACGQKDTLEITIDKPLIRTVEITQRPNCSGGSDVHVKVTSNFKSCEYPNGGSQFTTSVSTTSPQYTPFNTIATPPTATTNSVWEADYINVRPGNLLLQTYAYEGCTWDTTVVILPYQQPVINNADAYLCQGALVTNFTLTGGRDPYQYRIRPTGVGAAWSAYQSTTAFTGLTSGTTYDIEVQDVCPNGSITSFTPYEFKVRPIAISAPCSLIGSEVKFESSPIVGSTYVWKKAGVTVGTGPSLTIAAVALADFGIYELEGTSPTGCVDRATVELKACPLKVSGNVYNDVLGLTEPAPIVDGVGTNAGGPLFANLILDGKVVASVAIMADGTYSFDNVLPGNNYSMVLSTTAGVAGSTTIPTSSLPTGWLNTGENNAATAGSDGTVNGTSAPFNVVSVDVPNINFGIQQPPTPIGTNAPSVVNPDGTTQSADASALFTGTDPSGGIITSLMFTEFPVGATSITIGGVNFTTLAAIQAAYPTGIPTAPNGTPKVAITADPTATGATEVVFTFKVTDNAGAVSPTTAIVKLPFTGPLPLDLLSFTGKQLKETVVLTWKTANEREFSHFEVQKSINLNEFGQLGTISGSNSSYYNYFDNNPVEGINYYRLKMVDTDGSFKYSKIINITFKKDESFITIENPVKNGIINLKTNLENPSFTLLNSIGQNINISIRNDNSGQYSIILNNSKLGIYFLNIISGKKLQTKKLVVE